MEPMFNNQQEIDFLLKHLNPEYNVLEWGSGGSTLLIAKHVKRLVSVEHNKQWFDDISKEIKQQGLTNIDYNWYERNQEEKPGDDGTLEDYHDYVCLFARIIHDTTWCPFDVIFIDGRARVECARMALNLLKPDGRILIHDFFHPQPEYRRPEYEEVLDFLYWLEGAFTLHSFRKKTEADLYPGQKDMYDQLKKNK